MSSALKFFLVAALAVILCSAPLPTDSASVQHHHHHKHHANHQRLVRSSDKATQDGVRTKGLVN